MDQHQGHTSVACFRSFDILDSEFVSAGCTLKSVGLNLTKMTGSPVVFSPNCIVVFLTRR